MMHDIRMIRENPEAFDAALARRGMEAVSSALIGLDDARRSYETKQQQAQAKRNQTAKAIGQAKSKGDQRLYEELLETALLDKSIEDSTVEHAQKMRGELRSILSSLPNLPDTNVPDGSDETHNFEVSRWGTLHKFNFTPKEHADIGPALGLDFETGALISGSRFTFLRGQMARLQRALGQFMLYRQTIDNGYAECAPPLLVRDEAVFGTGQLPKFAEDLFRTELNLNEFMRSVFEQVATQSED